MNPNKQRKTGREYAETTIIQQAKTPVWKRPTAWLLAAGFGICLIGAGVGPKLSYEDTRRIKREIASLPMEERNQIDRNLQAFMAMPPADRDRYRQLDHDIEARGLMPLIDDYHAWLETLSPFQRQALRETNDPVARMAQVERILSENQELSEQRLAELISKTASSWHLKMLLQHHEKLDFDSIFVLTRDQIDTLIDDVLIPQLNTSQQQQMRSYTGDERVARVLRASLSMLNNARESWPTDRTFSMLEDQGVKLDDSEAAKRDDNGTRSFRYETWRRWAFRRLLVRSLLVQEMQEFERQNPVRDNDLVAFFAKLDSSTQATILDSPAEYQAEALRWLYLWETHRDEGLISREDFREHVIPHLVPGGGGRIDRDGRGPGGPGGPGGSERRGPGDRRNFDEDRGPNDGRRPGRPGPPPFGDGPPPEGPPPERPPGF